MAEQQRDLFSQVKDQFTRSRLASNAFFGFVLTGLEKLVEMEFACPCEAKWNAPFTAAFFVLPALLAFLLMINIQKCERKTFAEFGKNFLSCFAPALVWLILLYLDGRYYACYKSNWSGRFVSVPEDTTKKWCKPKLSGSYPSYSNPSPSREDRLEETLQLYIWSEVIGMILLTVLTVLVGLYTIAWMFKCICNIKCPCIDVEDDQDPGTPGQTVNEDTTRV